LQLSANAIALGDTIRITDCSKNALYTELYFGKGPLLTKKKEVDYVFEQVGTFTITLIAYPLDPIQDVSVQTQEVSVAKDPNTGALKACFLPQVLPLLEVFFINCSEGASRYTWQFGDGEQSTQINPTHQYAAPGTYPVTLTAYEPGTNTNKVQTLNVLVEDMGLPVACFAPSTTLATPGQEISFLNCSENAFRFIWEMGDGTQSTKLNPAHTYLQPGKYRVVLQAESANGALTDTTSLRIKVGDRYLANVVLLDYPILSADGNTWDPELPFPLPIPGIGPEPDISIRLKRGSDNALNTSVENDVTKDVLPLAYSLSQSLKIGGERWEISVVESDGVFGEAVMDTWVGSLDVLGSNGSIALQFGKSRLVLQYEVR
jgi:PKD repeat protein